ncbi:MAG TPA: hypothetical protein VF524_07815, partial [Polyangia bacterium]
LVQAKNRCGHGHFWVLIAPERHVLFEYTAKHDGAAGKNAIPRNHRWYRAIASLGDRCHPKK